MGSRRRRARPAPCSTALVRAALRPRHTFPAMITVSLILISLVLLVSADTAEDPR